jgi:hypothetical protein
VGTRDKIIIEERFGPLWSGPDSISIGDRIFTLHEIKRAFDLDTGDAIGIDLQVLPDERFAFRFYDGDDRRIVVFVFDRTLDIVEEHRAHLAEWLGNEYHESGMTAFDPEEMVRMLRKKILPEGGGPSG